MGMCCGSQGGREDGLVIVPSDFFIAKPVKQFCNNNFNHAKSGDTITQAPCMTIKMAAMHIVVHGH